MKIQEQEGRFFINDENGNLLAELTYTGEEVWHINRTFVDESLRGQGIAGKLMEAAVAKARADRRKIVPVCSYAVKAFEQNESYKELLAE